MGYLLTPTHSCYQHDYAHRARACQDLLFWWLQDFEAMLCTMEECYSTVPSTSARFYYSIRCFKNSIVLVLLESQQNREYILQR